MGLPPVWLAMRRTGCILHNTLLTTESIYSKLKHIIVIALSQSVHRSIASLLQLSLSSNLSGHRQPTLEGRSHTSP